MSNRSVSSFASVRCLFHLLQTTPLTIGNIVGGVYWKPIWNVLEGEVELLLCNAQHIKAVPGRKTDVKDAEWIADLLQHGRLASQLCASPPPTGTAGLDALPQ